MTSRTAGTSQRRQERHVLRAVATRQHLGRWEDLFHAARSEEPVFELHDFWVRAKSAFEKASGDQHALAGSPPSRQTDVLIGTITELQRQVVTLHSAIEATARRLDALASAQADRDGYSDSSETRSRERADLHGEFLVLARQWREETAGYSVITPKVAHSSYLRIIGMGPVAVPWILHELEEHGGHWYVALRAITGANPVPHEDRGRIPKMREAWLAWARTDGWID